MEDSSHSTPSPMSSAASSQDSLNVRGNYMNAAQHQAAVAAAAAKKRGVKSTLGRIFGKKDKQLKQLKAGQYVTAPMVNSPSGGFSPHPATYAAASGLGAGAEVIADMSTSDSMGGLGGIAGKGDFDRRKKKK